jgi:hypothetical protein
MTLHHRIKTALTLFGAVIAAGALGANHYFKSLDMTSTQPLPALRIVCVGRLLFDLPADIELKGDVELYYGLDKDFDTAMVKPLKEGVDQAAFEKIVAERIAELTQDYNASSASKNMLSGVRKIDDQTVMILAYTELPGTYVSEALIRRGQAVGIVKRDVYNNADMGGRTDDPADIEAKVLALAQRITAVGDDPARIGTGTCIGGLLIDADHDGEVFTLGARSSRHRDVTLGIDMNSIIAKSDGGMLARWDSKADMIDKLTRGALHTSRRGATTMASRPAEELLTYGRNTAGKLERTFNAETRLLKPSSFAEPQFHIDMHMGGQDPETGAYVDPSFSEPDALELWDAILKSIRPRPGAI